MKLTPLIVKKLNKTISKEEEKIFNEWLSKSKSNKELFSRLKEIIIKGSDITELENLDSGAAWDKVQKSYKFQKNQNSKRLILKSTLKYAAIFIGLLTLGYGYYEYSASSSKLSEQDSNVITLQLDNGKVQILSTDDTHSITDSQGNILGRKQGNILDYKDTKEVEKLVFNTLTIPYGKKFKLVLSDGSTVHLNAGSSIRYPIKFLKNNNRQVYLTGEAFFNVSTDKEHPFVVSTNKMNITVLGTEFNVSAYPEDAHINTVLVEGSVKLSNINDKLDSIRLEPGFKAKWDVNSNKTVLEKVDTDIYTSWMSGRLIIKNQPFKNIVKQLERHYNIQIKNNYEDLNNQIYTAAFDDETIEEVLGSFAENKKFNYKINDNIITIDQP